MQEVPEPRATRGKRFPRLLSFLAIVLVVIALVIVILVKGQVAFFSGPVTIIGLPDGGTVVTQIRDIGRFETVSYTIEKVIPYDQDANSWLHFLGDHTKLFVVHGEVIAGFDLKSLSKKDIQIDEKTKTITVNLPGPQVLETVLDTDKTRVYDSNTGVYGVWNEGLDPNTELQILTASRKSLQNDACTENILQQASNSARQQFTSFLTSVGFKTVIINIPDGTC